MTTLSKPMKKNSPLMQDAIDFYVSQADLLIETEDFPAVADFRRCIAEHFKEVGFPTRRDEDWHYTPLTGFLKNRYRLQGISQISEEQVTACLPPLPAIHLVFVDGYFSERDSDDLGDLPSGLIIEPVKDTLDFDSGYENLMKHEAFVKREAFGCLNSMLFDDGVNIHASPNCNFPESIVCTFIQTQNEHANIVRNQISLEKGAELNLVVQYISASDELNAFDNIVTEIDLAEGAKLNQTVLQELSPLSCYFGLQYIKQSKESVFKTHYVALGAALSRHQNYVAMTEDSIETEQSSVSFGKGSQIIDTRTYTSHQSTNGLSRQSHRLVADDKSTGVFDGMILVKQDAQKTDGLMDNKNLMLTNDAKIYSKPQLEIYADDVQCSHGSTFGQISEEQIFYLRARGIPEEQARLMVTQAFLVEPLETMSNDVIREWLAEKIIAKLHS